MTTWGGGEMGNFGLVVDKFLEFHVAMYVYHNASFTKISSPLGKKIS